MEKRTTIRLNTHTLEILSKAASIWPEHEDNFSELIRQVIADWDRIRNENGGRSTQIMCAIREVLEAIKELKNDHTHDDDRDTDHG